MNQLRELLIGAVSQGPVPQHIAFVMDGNRRFARSHKIETAEGHNLGFESLAKVCERSLSQGMAILTRA
jgi:ditrans,polycis-polyprenyl diphosphate synthase